MMKKILFLLAVVILSITINSCNKKEVELKYYTSFTLDGEQKIIFAENKPVRGNAYISFPNDKPNNYHPEQFTLTINFDYYQININYLNKAEFFYITSPNNKSGGSGHVNITYNNDNTFSGTFSGVLDNGWLIDQGKFNNIKFKN